MRLEAATVRCSCSQSNASRETFKRMLDPFGRLRSRLTANAEPLRPGLTAKSEIWNFADHKLLRMFDKQYQLSIIAGLEPGWAMADLGQRRQVRPVVGCDRKSADRGSVHRASKGRPGCRFSPKRQVDRLGEPGWNGQRSGTRSEHLAKCF